MNRRQFGGLTLAAAAGTATGSLRGVSAAQSTPELAVCADDALPVLEIEINDDGFVIPETVQAGLTRVVMTNTGTLGDSHYFLARLADGITDEQLATFMDTQGEQGIDFEKDLTYLGAPDWPWPDSDPVNGVVNFEPGRYLAINIAETVARGLGQFTVEGEATATCEPASDLTIVVGEMVINIPTDQLYSGQMTWRIENHGAIQHEVVVLPVPEDFTADDLMTLMMLDEGATPPPDVPNLEFAPVAAIGVLSPQATSWLDVNLSPGHYLAACMVPFGTGYPHAMDGMYVFFDLT